MKHADEKFLDDAIEILDGKGEMDYNDFVEEMKARDWVNNGRFLIRAKESGLTITFKTLGTFEIPKTVSI